MAAPLVKIYNESLNSGCGWKRSNVTCVHKGGSCDSPGDCRHILELSSYFETNQLYSAYQGYRKGKSTEQLLMVAVATVFKTKTGYLFSIPRFT